jgi:hypothetical protein
MSNWGKRGFGIWIGHHNLFWEAFVFALGVYLGRHVL